MTKQKIVASAVILIGAQMLIVMARLWLVSLGADEWICSIASLPVAGAAGWFSVSLANKYLTVRSEKVECANCAEITREIHRIIDERRELLQ
jgi:hypothetical protein